MGKSRKRGICVVCLTCHGRFHRTLEAVRSSGWYRTSGSPSSLASSRPCSKMSPPVSRRPDEMRQAQLQRSKPSVQAAAARKSIHKTHTSGVSRRAPDDDLRKAAGLIQEGKRLMTKTHPVTTMERVHHEGLASLACLIQTSSWPVGEPDSVKTSTHLERGIFQLQLEGMN